MDGLAGGASDGTDGEAFWRGLGAAIVAFALALCWSIRGFEAGQTPTDLNDRLNLTIEARCPTLNQRYISREAHFVDVASSVDIVERIEDDIETCEPIDIELWIFDIGVVGLQLDMRVEFRGALLGDLKDCR